jgi:hypothetical protein
MFLKEVKMGHYYQDEIFCEIHYVDKDVDKDNIFYKRGCGCLISIFIIACLTAGGYIIFNKLNNNKKHQNIEKIQKNVKNNVNNKNTAVYNNFFKTR